MISFMEKSTNSIETPGHRLLSPLTLTASLGMSFLWVSLYCMIMRNSFMDVEIDILWYHLFMRMALLLGAFISCAILAHNSDLLANERGHRILTGGTFVFSAVAAVSSFTAHTFNVTLPLFFDVVALGVAGAGLAALLFLWLDILAGLDKDQAAASLGFSAIIGAGLYLISNLLPYPFNVIALALLPILSVGMHLIVEEDPGYLAPAYISNEDSANRAKLSPSFKLITLSYGIVFGLGIGSISQLEGSLSLFVGSATFLFLGSLFALFYVKHASNHVDTSESRLLFPLLAAALIPMSFLEGSAYIACNLFILACSIFYTLVSINAVLEVAKSHKASHMKLIAGHQAALFFGCFIGHAAGLAATITGIANYSMLSKFALGLVVVLAAFVTFAPLRTVHQPEEKKEKVKEEAEPQPGRWHQRCERVAQEAGLSARETEVFMLLAKGRGVEHIQNKLYISGHTVKTHTYNIYRKMGINSREELLDAIEAVDLFDGTHTNEETHAS